MKTTSPFNFDSERDAQILKQKNVDKNYVNFVAEERLDYSTLMNPGKKNQQEKIGHDKLKRIPIAFDEQDRLGRMLGKSQNYKRNEYNFRTNP